PDDVDQRHRRLDQDTFMKRSGVVDDVQVPIPADVTHEPGYGVLLGQHRVHQVDGVVTVGGQHPAQISSYVAHRFEIGTGPGASAGVTPPVEELRQVGEGLEAVGIV